MENLLVNIGDKEAVVVRTIDCTNAIKSKVIIENAAGQEMFVLSFLNDGSEYSISEKGINKFSKYIK